MAQEAFRPSLPMRLVYLFFRIVFGAGLLVFYRRRLVLGRQYMRFSGPAIVIVNHPSTLMDVLNPGLHIPREMYFLANYGLFRHPVTNWLFRRLFCIPVMRREDLRDGETRNLDEVFGKSFEHLQRGGVLFMAPEGTSWMNRFVRPLKTGAARIALGVEAREEGQGELRIVPVGLSYSAPDKFRSEVVINAGEPIRIADWLARYGQAPEPTVEELTNHLRATLQQLSIHTGDEEGERAFNVLEKLLYNSFPVGKKAAFYRNLDLAEKVRSRPDLRQRAADWQAALDETGLTDRGLALSQKPFRQGWLLLAGFPLFFPGMVFWFLPCFIPWFVNKRLNLYVGYGATVKMITGLLSFPAALWALWAGVNTLAGPLLAWASIPLVVLLGYFVEQYLDIGSDFLARRQALRKHHQRHTLLNNRKELLQAVSSV